MVLQRAFDTFVSSPSVRRKTTRRRPMNDRKQPEYDAQNLATDTASLAYRAPRVVVVGSTREALRGHHGVGQESQGYAPKQGT
jgi:hypothetical protein